MPSLKIASPRPAATVFALSDAPPAELAALYVHIPFCVHKCHYCDFYSITSQPADRMSRFVELALAEAAIWVNAGRQTVRPRTVFFGGGTPTLLPPAEMRQLLRGLAHRFDLSAVTEWTCECNPATVRESYGQEYLAMLREEGVNRLSFGVQSFDEQDLVVLERHHRPGDVEATLAAARAAGFGRLNVDLIYGTPGQSLESWTRTLARAIALGTEHLSCYDLTYEPNTALTARKDAGQIRPAEESVELAMFHHARRRLAEAGLPAYEVSNYARPGAACRHNLAYWHGDSYAAIGPGGASHVAGVRWKNRPHLGEWETRIAEGALPAVDVEHLTSRQRAGELAMLRLRLADGIDLADFRARTGSDALTLFADPIDRFARAGLLDPTPTHVRLTERGWEVADAVAGEFL